MTDLIKRLHHHANGDCDMTPVGSTLLEAADRIEELEKQCSFYARSDQFLVEEINELEAKLTKAEAYLQKISRHANRSCAAIAAHALAELEGGE